MVVDGRFREEEVITRILRHLCGDADCGRYHSRQPVLDNLTNKKYVYLKLKNDTVNDHPHWIEGYT